MKKIKLYPGKLEISANYRENNILGRNLAYLSLANSDFTGRVENFVLKDEDNLSYRDDLSKTYTVSSRISPFFVNRFAMGAKKYCSCYRLLGCTCNLVGNPAGFSIPWVF